MVNSRIANNLQEALEYRSKYQLIPYGGGTDLMIHPMEETAYLFLHKVPEMRKITQDKEYIRIGTACTFTEIAEHELPPFILREAVMEIAAPAIRNFGTVGGNLGNGSPKADSALIFFVMDAKLRIMSVRGERILPIKEFYRGRKNLDLESDELIVEVLLPQSSASNYYYKKVGARNALAIARVSFAGILDVKEGRIINCATAFGAVSDVIIRREDIDAMLIGKTIAEAKAKKAEYLKAFDEAIQPIRGRISSEYRKDVCMNLLNDFLETAGIK